MKLLKRLTILMLAITILLSVSTTDIYAAMKTTKFKDIANNYWAKKRLMK